MSGMNKWSVAHTLAVVLNAGLLGLWLLASATTSVYFHLPLEKITGFCTSFLPLVFTVMDADSLTVLGVAGYAISQFIVSMVLPREKGNNKALKTQ